jgi:hypothetical protein
VEIPMNNTLRNGGLAILVAMASATGHAQQAEEPPKAQQASEAAAGDGSGTLKENEFTVTANGAIQLNKDLHSPIYAEFEGSSTLTSRLRESLKERGLEVTEDKSSAKASLVFKGDVVILGGKKFFKGAKTSIGKATEQTLASSQKELRTADVTQTVAAMALNGAALGGAMNNFTKGLAIGGMANALGDASGLKAWFNTAVAGDPRGICLSRCEEWSKVNQTVYVYVRLEAAGAKEDVRVMAKAFSETVAPDQVIQFGVGKAIDQIKVADTREQVSALGQKKD